MLSFLLRLPVNLLLIALWLLWAPFALIGSPVGLVLAVLAAVFAVYALEGEPYGLLPAMVLLIANRGLAKRPWPRPPAIVWYRPRPKRIKPQAVPVLQGLTKTAEAPSVSDTVGRLSPALRRVIAEPPPQRGDTAP